MDAIAGAVQDYGRHGDRRLRDETLLDRLERRIAGGVAEPMAVGLNDDRDEILVIERDCAALERRVVEAPARRPQAPQQPAERAPVFPQPGAAALAVEIVLIPVAMLLLGIGRHDGARDVL